MGNIVCGNRMRANFILVKQLLFIQFVYHHYMFLKSALFSNFRANA